MSFQWPWALLLLVLVPLFVGAYVMVQQRRSKYAVRFTNLDLLANVVDETPAWRRHIPPAMYIAAIAALLLAFARPGVDHQVPKEEATVILVFDVSGSMNATDIEPTRLEAARLAGKTLIEELPDGFKVSIVSFSNAVQTLVPPTAEREEALLALNRLRSNGGTAIGDAIVHALDIARPPDEVPIAGTPPAGGGRPTPTPTAPGAAPTPAVMVLLGDGAQTTGQTQPLVAAQMSKEQEVPIFTVALGTPSGIAEVQDNLGRVRRIPVPPDEETLQEIANITDAKFFSAPTAEDLTSVYEDLGSKIGYESEQTEITWLFAGLGAALVLAAGATAMAWFNRFP